MEEIFIGELIKRRRMELGLTQERLCEGICEPITISRLENGKQTPSCNRINALLERLDLPTDRYYALLNKNEFLLTEQLKKIVSLNNQFSHALSENKPAIRKLALEAHRELEELAGEDDMIAQQAIVRSLVILGKEDGPYTSEEQQQLLLKAIRLTVPSFQLDDFSGGLYSTDEVKIINQLALSYAYAEKHMEAIEILSQLYKYIRKHFHNILPTRAHIGMVAFNYSRELLAVSQYKKAAEIAEEGRRACLEYGNYQSLSGLLSVLAEASYFQGEREKSKELYYQTYYLLKTIGDYCNLEVLRSDAKKFLNLDFLY